MRRRYIRDSFFAARSFTTIDDLNRQALSWRDQIAGGRRWIGDDRKTVAEAFREEAAHLLPLPEHPFETDLVAHRTTESRARRRRSGSRPPGVMEQRLQVDQSGARPSMLGDVAGVGHREQRLGRRQGGLVREVPKLAPSLFGERVARGTPLLHPRPRLLGADLHVEIVARLSGLHSTAPSSSSRP
jgi:hypothetical protein